MRGYVLTLALLALAATAQAQQAAPPTLPSSNSMLHGKPVAVAALEASPFCRTQQTAELAFGRAPQVNADLLYHSTQTPDQVAAANAKLRARLATAPPGGGNVVLVGHSPTMKEAAAVELPEGQGAIVKPTGDGSFRIVARLTEAGITPVP